MKRGVLNLYKKRGETPLERITRFKLENPGFEEVKMSYAGRLDPMAEGVLLVLVGEENKRRHTYLDFRKDYIFDVLFGVRTDTYDILGKVSEDVEVPYNFSDLTEQVARELANFKGRIMQSYPPFSSKPVKGKEGKGRPLFEWAREGNLALIEIPEKEVEIYEIQPLLTYTLPRDLLSKLIFETIVRVNGDFRQKSIFESWVKFFEATQRDLFDVVRLKISCSSGTYVRGIVNSLGKKIGVPTLAFKIVRTKIGEHRLEDSL